MIIVIIIIIIFVVDVVVTFPLTVDGPTHHHFLCSFNLCILFIPLNLY